VKTINHLLAFLTGTVAAYSLAGQPPAEAARAEKIFPYLVPSEYLKHGALQPDQITRLLGHDLYIVLVQELNGSVRNVLPTDLQKLGLTPQQAQAKADENLGALIKKQTIKSSVFPNGPGGKPFALFGGHWAAAAAATWTGLHGALSKALGSEALIVSVPHREAMLVFRDGDAAYVESVKTMIREKEADGQKPLTWELFTLTKDGLQPRK
jgi:hypothetical protein